MCNGGLSSGRIKIESEFKVSFISLFTLAVISFFSPRTGRRKMVTARESILVGSMMSSEYLTFHFYT